MEDELISEQAAHYVEIYSDDIKTGPPCPTNFTLKYWFHQPQVQGKYEFSIMTIRGCTSGNISEDNIFKYVCQLNILFLFAILTIMTVSSN